MNRNATVMINKDSVVKTWLSEFKALSECDIPCYAKTINGNTLIINALHEVLGERANELLEPMCHQLAQFCCAEQQELCLFTFQFLPELIWKHLSGVARQDKPSQSCVEGLLLEMYNLDVRDPDGDMMSSFVVPSLLQPSIYHEPCAFGSFGFTDYVIQQSKVKKLVYRQAIHHHEWITAQNRFQVLTFLLQYYNMHITSMRQSSICSFCKVFSRMSMSGLPRPDHHRGSRGKHPRINLTAVFMVQMLETVHYAIYNGEWDVGKRALEDILYRAKFDLLFEPLLLGRAIRNALLWDAPHCLRKGSVCVSLDLNTTPRRASQTVVTSASIRGHRWKKEGIDMSPVELFHEDILAERWPIMDIARPHTTNIAEQKQEGCDSWVDVHREAPLEVVAEDERLLGDDEIVFEDCTKPTTPQAESDFTSGLGMMESLTVSSSHAMNNSQLEFSSAQPLFDTPIDMTSELQHSHPKAVELALKSLLPSPTDLT